jgi:ATP phosphoribosyltransferase
MTSRLHGLTQSQINRLVEQIEAVENSHYGSLMVDTEALNDTISSGRVSTKEVERFTIAEDELKKTLQVELVFYQKSIDEIERKLAKLTPDKFLYRKLNAYKNALIKAQNVGHEIVFSVELLK